MRKTINRERIEGRIYDHSLAVKVTGPSSKAPGTEYIGGSMDVATDDVGLNIVTIYYTYVTPTTSTGGVNKTYSVLKQIIDSGKTVVAEGMANATMVRCDTSLAINDFYSERAKSDTNPDGLISGKRNEGGFVSIVAKLDEEKKRNTFETDMFINKIREIAVDDGDDYIGISGYVFNFRNDVLPVEFFVKSPGGIKYFDSLDISNENPVFTKVWGNIVSQVVKTQSEGEETAFGESIVREYTRNIREWVVTGASNTGYELGTDITSDELKDAIARRETHLAEVKARQDAYEASKNAIASPAPAATSASSFNF